MIAQAVGFFRVPSSAPIWDEFTDVSSDPVKAPHIEVLFGDGFAHALPPADPGNYFSMSHLNLTPNSRGAITITSSDPFAFPAIDPNLLGTKHDVYIAVEGTRIPFCRDDDPCLRHFPDPKLTHSRQAMQRVRPAARVQGLYHRRVWYPREAEDRRGDRGVRPERSQSVLFQLCRVLTACPFVAHGKTLTSSQSHAGTRLRRRL